MRTETRQRRARARCAAFVAAAIALASSPASAAPPRKVLHNDAAREHFAAAKEAFERDDYAAAIPELKAAYAIEPNPMLLYSWAQAERLNGNCKRAIELYGRFIDTEPAEESKQLAEVNILECEAELGDGPPPPPPPANADDMTDPADPPDAVAEDPVPEDEGEETAPPPPKSWKRDWVGWTLTGLGLATVGTGGVVFALGRRQAVEAPDAAMESAYLAEKDASRRKQRAGGIVAAVGGGVLVIGIIRLVVVGTRAQRRADTARHWVGPTTVRF